MVEPTSGSVDEGTRELGESERRRQADALAQRFAIIVQRIEAEASNRETLRTAIEDRWLLDMQQYHGKYDDQTEALLKSKGRSQIFVNLTRPKTKAVTARLFDMLFPTDDRNWDIEPTPVPDLTDSARQVAAEITRIGAEITEQGGEAGPQQDSQLAQAKAQSAALKHQMDEAERRCNLMRETMDDQLVECDYPAVARDVIKDACKIGSGVLKGPIINGSSRRRWSQAEGGVFELKPRETKAPPPKFMRVDPWDFFPDPDARTIAESEGVYERHLLNRKQLRALADRKGFNADAIRTVLRSEPKHSTPQSMVQLRAIIGSHTDTSVKRYHVWEYHGPMELEDIRAVIDHQGDPEAMAAFDEIAEDPLTELHVTAWVCQGQLLFFGPYPLDSNEPLYSVFNYEEDESSIFGFGIPYLMRDPQKVVSAAWRMMLDNGGVASGSQVVIDPKVVEPADGSGDYSLQPMKTWLRKSTSAPGERPFETFDIPMHQSELANIVNMAQGFVDAETGVSQIAEGEQGANITKTLGGMSILMNSANILFRAAVKNWDDDVTTPSYRRLYDWNMQFSRRDDIKGDYEIKARGTSVLLVREIESQSLMAIAMHFTAHPVLGPLTKAAPLYRRLVQSMMVPADEVVKTDDDLEREAAMAQKQPPEPHPDVLKAETTLNVAEIDRDTRLNVARLQHETAMMQLAEQRNISMDKLMAMLEQTRMNIASAERKVAAEAAVTNQTGPTGGGFF